MPMIAWWKEFRNTKVSCISEWSTPKELWNISCVRYTFAESPFFALCRNADVAIQVYIVATNDRDLKRRIRKIPGVSVTRSSLTTLESVVKMC